MNNYDTKCPQDFFRYAFGMIEDDFGDLIPISDDAWNNRYAVIYGHGFYDCRAWPIETSMGHI